MAAASVVILDLPGGIREDFPLLVRQEVCMYSNSRKSDDTSSKNIHREHIQF